LLRQRPRLNLQNHQNQSKSESSKTETQEAAPPQASKQALNPLSLAEFQKHCLDFKLCVISFFSEENTGSDLHKKFLETLDKVTQKNYKSFSFVWVDGVHHIDLMQFLHLESGFPSLAVISPSKKVYAPYVGSYEADKINSFLDKLLRGAKPTIQLPGELEPHLAAFNTPPSPPQADEDKKSEL